ncbi:sushi, von Willebrand factor type A, EGF and pentraxin domain-containing protein 1 [Elysia marginata]|uniref:Sushi, von Willebrand factor type A, EGF and pentraxin domain-containing protein 1 n=1 Tax=Elysia marginata TaxID=1093978 RepID=A0AAV4IR82_9GAST|nr:sushi, von Willebrand factor type A, EGF and pentraxin domain-containing protein 1 [Elysia marginata]
MPTSSEQVLMTSADFVTSSETLAMTSSITFETLLSSTLSASSEILLFSSTGTPITSSVVSTSSATPSLSSTVTPVSSSATSASTTTPSSSNTEDSSSSHSTSDVILSSSSVFPVTWQPGTMCSCQCPNDLLSTPLDSSQIEQMTSSIQKELYVNEREVSATKRKYISVNDQRPSAQTVGYFGVCIVAVTFSGIFLMDIGSLARDIIELVNACKRGE